MVPCVLFRFLLLLFVLSSCALLAAGFKFRGKVWSSKFSVLAASDSPKDQDLRADEIKRQLASIIDPESGTSIVESGRIKEIRVSSSGSIDIQLHAKSAKSVIAEEIKKLCILESSMIEWAQNVSVELVVPTKPDIVAAENRATTGGISQVKEVIAVSSCKGGVGKSTVAVNLAYSLSQLGYRVGILDADIYGPSLPTMTSPSDVSSMISPTRLQPATFEGVKLMSMGFLKPGSAIMRGPMVNQLLNQFVSVTDWGALDFLLLDLPPGTGDVQLTLAQTLNISAAVIVTTPQRLSFVDVVKGIDMFDVVNVPCIAVVENMARFSSFSFNSSFFLSAAKELKRAAESGHTSEEQLAKALKELMRPYEEERKVFGEGHSQRLREMWGFDTILSLPVLEDISRAGDSGRPFVLSHPSSEVAQSFQRLAANVVQEVAALKVKEAGQKDTVLYDEVANLIQYKENAISSKVLRCRCRCAGCVEEFTGKKILDETSIPNSIKPLKMMPIGRYAWSIDWSDGHKSLYPFKQLSSI